MLPNFLILGAQKAGSSFLYECLKQHPDVYGPRYEVAFFENPYYLEKDIAHLEHMFDRVSVQRAVGIKRPDYLAREECPERIFKHLPSAKLIAVLRNPVDRAVSAYFWFMQVGIIPIKPLQQGILDILNGLYLDQYPKSQEIIDYGFYSQHLRNYLRYFDREQIMILLYNDLKKDPRQVIKQTYRFLELDTNYIPKALTRQPKKSVYSLARLKWLSIANKNFFYTYRQDNRNMVVLYNKNKSLFRLIYYMLIAVDRYVLAHLFNNPKPELDKSVRKRLADIYRKDVADLSRIWGCDLSM